jgi:hypothetical protein
MKAILADNDIRGQLEVFIGVWQGPAWRSLWEGLALTVQTFATLGLGEDASDAEVWSSCQNADTVLVTANRNNDGPDSLHATISRAATLVSLPVITLANARRVMIDKPYARQTAEKILEYLLDIEKYRGTGRLYVP